MPYDLIILIKTDDVFQMPWVEYKRHPFLLMRVITFPVM